MKYQPLNDLIDPDVVPEGAVVPEPEEQDADAPNDAYVIGERGNTVQAPDASRKKRESSDGPKRWVKPLALLMGALCIGLTVWNVSRAIQGPPPRPTPSPFQLKQALYLGAMKIEAYRKIHGATPEVPADSGLEVPPYGYTRVSPTQYQLTLESAGAKLEYDSAIGLERFFGTPQQMLAMGDSQ